MNPIAATHSETFYTSQLNDPKKFMDELNTWLNNPTIYGNKEEAYKRIQTAYNNGDNTLVLANLRLTSLPEQIGNLTNLVSLNLGSNNLASLPEQIGNLTNLKWLYLRSNNLASLPEQIGNLTNLELLYLESNKLASLPEQIGNLTNLELLYLGSNKLASLPEQIGNLTNLVSLNLRSNNLASLPEQIGSLTNLVSLNLDRNNLASLPEQIGNLTNLEWLNISYNPNLSNLPLSFQSLTLITHINTTGTGISTSTRDHFISACQANRREFESEKKLPISLNLWAEYAQFNKNDLIFILNFTKEEKGSLYDWMLRLTKTSDFRSQQETLATTVCNMLKSLETNQDFKTSFFAQINANLECCQDRAAIALNEIYTSWKLYNLPKDASIQESLIILGKIARTNTLRKRLSTLIDIRQKEKNVILNESTEIYLFYETSLREILDLETAVVSRSYGPCERNGECSRDWINEDALIQYVKENYQQELITLPAFEEIAKKDSEYQDHLSAIKLSFEGIQEKLEEEKNEINENDYLSEYEKIKNTLENKIAASKINWLQNNIGSEADK